MRRIPDNYLNDASTFVPLEARMVNGRASEPVEEGGNPLFSKSGEELGDFHSRLVELSKTKTWFFMLGEPGVGKRHSAQWVHSISQQTHAGEFVELSASTTNEELQAVLFNEDRKRCEGMLGRPVPYLDGRSTLFINHVDEFSLFAQTRLVRFMSEQSVRSASSELLPRMIVSTTIPWPVTAGKRALVESLEKQIGQLPCVTIPPLRERSGEIPEIVGSILRHISGTGRQRRLVINPEVLKTLQCHHWRDNVVELDMVLRDAVRRSRNGEITLSAELLDEVGQVEKSINAIRKGKNIRLDGALSSLERLLIQRSLARCKDNLERSARQLGLTEQNLRYRIRKYNLYVPPKRKRK